MPLYGERGTGVHGRAIGLKPTHGCGRRSELEARGGPEPSAAGAAEVRGPQRRICASSRWTLARARSRACKLPPAVTPTRLAQSGRLVVASSGPTALANRNVQAKRVPASGLTPTLSVPLSKP